MERTLYPANSLVPLTLPAAFDLEELIKLAVEEDDMDIMEDDLELHMRLFTQNSVFSALANKTRPRLPSLHDSSSQSHRNRKRALNRRKNVHSEGHTASQRTLFEHAQLADKFETAFDAKELASEGGGYSVHKLREHKSVRERDYTLKQLLEDGFELIEWDGRDPRPLVDQKGRIFAVLAGKPNDAAYDRAARAAFDMILRAGQAEDFGEEELHHRRGHFPALPFGISYGNGQSTPKRLKEGTHSALIRGLLGSDELQRLALYADAFQLWAPKLYAYYQAHMQALENTTGERRNFSGSVFACALVNFGPRVRSFKHRDSLNLPFGWCAIQALGNFDPKVGGHLVIWELRLVVQFPPSSTILLPSATLTHSNIGVRDHEMRVSFTQYSSGGLFRWVDNGFCTEQAVQEQDQAKYAKICKLKETRWKMGMGLFSTLDELLRGV